jgi:hypothetical protein
VQLYRCDQCRREQPRPLPFTLERKEVSLAPTLEDDPRDPDFCTLECVVGWCLVKLLDNEYKLTVDETGFTITGPGGRISRVNAGTTTSG